MTVMADRIAIMSMMAMVVVIVMEMMVIRVFIMIISIGIGSDEDDDDDEEAVFHRQTQVARAFIRAGVPSVICATRPPRRIDQHLDYDHVLQVLHL